MVYVVLFDVTTVTLKNVTFLYVFIQRLLVASFSVTVATAQFLFVMYNGTAQINNLLELPAPHTHPFLKREFR